MHKQCMDEWWVRADHAFFFSLPGRPVWPQLPGDVPESSGLSGAELLPARPLWLLLCLRLEWLPLRPRYRDRGVHQLSHPPWASSRAWLLSSSTSANLSASEGQHRLSSTAACISCLLSLWTVPWPGVAVSSYLPTACPSGFYGPDCALECTCQNGGICNRFSGCVCPAGWHGQHCEKSGETGTGLWWVSSLTLK